MKICFVSDYLPGVHSIWSGAEVVCTKLSAAIEKLGHECFFLTTYGHDNIKLNPQTDKKFEFYKTIYLLKTPSNMGIWSYFLYFDIYCFFKAIKILKHLKPDIIHIHAKRLFLPVLLASKFLRIPVFYTVVDYNLVCPKNTLIRHDGKLCINVKVSMCYKCTGPTRTSIRNIIILMINYFLILSRKFIYDWSIKQIKTFITFTETSKAKLITYGIPASKIKIIYQYELSNDQNTVSISSEYFQNPTIFFLGALHEHKGLGVIIEALKEIVKYISNVTLLVVGSAWNNIYIDKVKSNICAYKLENNVIFLGQRENKEVLEFIRNSKVVVVPEQWPSDFGPVILLEGLGLGKPVVASRVGAAHEFVQNGVNGFLVEHNKPEEFADRILRLLKNPQIAEQLGNNAMKSTEFLRDGTLPYKITALYYGIRRE